MSAKKILIVDDDTHLVAALTARLKYSGYEVVTAMDAICAISTARRERPDLVLLDLGLPGGDGFVVMDRMKELSELSGIPVVVLSGREAHGNKQRALAARAVAFIQKAQGTGEAFLSAIRYALAEPKALSAFLAT